MLMIFPPNFAMIKYKDDSKNNLNLKEIWMFIDRYKFSNQKLFLYGKREKITVSSFVLPNMLI